MVDFDDPKLKPLWLRLVIVGFSLGWAVLELATGAPGWAVIFFGIGGFLGWRLLVTYAPEDRDRSQD